MAANNNTISNINTNNKNNMNDTSVTTSISNGIQLDKYVSALNGNCPSLDEYRVKWTADDLNPQHIRNYCKIDKNGTFGICWSCSDYINQYKTELGKWEHGPGTTMALLAELKQAQMELDKKLERILTLLEPKFGGSA